MRIGRNPKSYANEPSRIRAEMHLRFAVKTETRKRVGLLG